MYKFRFGKRYSSVKPEPDTADKGDADVNIGDAEESRRIHDQVSKPALRDSGITEVCLERRRLDDADIDAALVALDHQSTQQVIVNRP